MDDWVRLFEEKASLRERLELSQLETVLKNMMHSEV